MNTAAPSQNPLAQLRDIHLPEPIGWWPLSASLWVALILVITALLTVGWMFYKRHQKNRYRRQALAQLKRQIADYRQHRQQHTLCQQLLVILRRCLLSANRESVAINLSAAHLLQQLNLKTGKPLFSAELCEQAQLLAYAAHPSPHSHPLSEQQIDKLLSGARTCIKAMP